MKPANMGRNVTARYPAGQTSRGQSWIRQACSCPPALKMIASSRGISVTLTQHCPQKSHVQIGTCYRITGALVCLGYLVGGAFCRPGPLIERNLLPISGHGSEDASYLFPLLYPTRLDRRQVCVHTLIAGSSPEDWRTWSLHVTDDKGEIFAVPFSSVLGRGLQ